MGYGFVIFYTILGTLLSLVGLFAIIATALARPESLTAVRVWEVVKYTIIYVAMFIVGLILNLVVFVIGSIIAFITFIVTAIIRTVKHRKKK